MSVINTRSFGRFWPVSWTITLFLGPGVISMIGETPGCVYVSVINTRSFVYSGPFRRVLLSFGGAGVISTIYEPRGAFSCWSMTLTILANFWSVSCTITHRFGVPERFPLFTNPAVCLRLYRQHSLFWPILTRFVDY